MTDKTAAITGKRSLPGINQILQRYATAATIPTFIVVALSGSLIFFHIGNPFLMGLHEWLGIAFAVFAIFHVIRHFRPFTKYFQKTRTRVLLAATLAISAIFIGTAATGDGKGNPLRELSERMQAAPLSEISFILDSRQEELITRLQNAGIPNVSADNSLLDLERSSGRDIRELAAIALGRSR